MWFLAARFFTGAGIGGEYSAINSAIDEMIPARARGRVDLIINGSFWLGAVIGGLASIVLLKESLFALDVGWRLAFGIGATLGLGILFLRRNLPESPRWLFIHGREEEAERLVDEIEGEVREDTGQELEEPGRVDQGAPAASIPFRDIARTVFKVYPKRAVLGLSLFIGQAFLYNAVTVTLGLTLTTYLGVGANKVGLFYAVFAAGNFLGPLLLGRLFDTVGRQADDRRHLPDLGGDARRCRGDVRRCAHNGEAVQRLGADPGAGRRPSSSPPPGASSAYLTVSEIFPMEIRALAIAFFYAIGTAIGGITGPLVFQKLGSGDVERVMIAYLIGAAVMAVGGIVELILGVRAEQRQLEDIAKPITAAEAEGGAGRRRSGAERRPRTDRRHARALERERRGLRRYRPGSREPPPSRRSSASRASATRSGSTTRSGSSSARFEEHGELRREELARRVGARYWGPGRFRAALREALREGEVHRASRSTYAAGPGGDEVSGPGQAEPGLT